MLYGIDVGFPDPGGGVPVLHLYGEAGGRPPLPSLFEALLLFLRAAMADGAEVTVPPLSCLPAPSRAGQLPLGGGGHSTNRNHADHLGKPKR